MSTRFYSGQKDYIVQLNLMEDEFQAATADLDAALATVTGKADTSGDTFTGTVVLSWAAPALVLNETDQAVDAKRWAVAVVASELAFQVRNDADGITSTPFKIARNGAVTFTGTVTGTFSGNLTGNVTGTASNATNVAVTNDTTTNTTYYPTFVTATSGNTGVRLSSTKLTFNPSTGVLSATGFSGPLTGNVTGNVTGNASSASTAAITNDSTTNSSHYITFTTSNSGNGALKSDSAKLLYNPSTGVISASGFTTTGAATVGGNLTVTGNLTVNGTTTVFNSTTIQVDDPIITLGGDTAPTVDDNKDKGVEFRWHNGSVAKVGFFGFDDSTGKFTFIPDATNASEVFSGAVGTITANLEGNVTGNVSGTAANITGVAAATNGGTGISSYTTGDILYASSTTTLAKLAGVATGNALLSGGVGTASSWGKIGLTTHVSGTLPNGNGGTGKATAWTQWGLVYADTTGTLSNIAAGTSGNILRSNGAAAPSWTTIATLLGYTAANKAGDTFTGAVTFSSTTTFTGNATFNGNDGIKVPVGTTANRPANLAGLVRYNSDTSSFEGNNGTAWGSIGGGAKGGGPDQVFQENDNTITTSYTIPAGKNASTVGPLTINTGAIITVSTGSRLVIL